MSLLRSDLWGEVARNFGGHYLESAVSATGATTVITDTVALPAYYNDFMNDAWAAIVTDAGGAHAAPEGQARRISDFVASTGVVTVSQAFTAAPATGDTYRIWAGPPLPDIMEAVKSALRAAWPDWYQDKTDTTLATITDTYEYTVPAAIEHLTGVFIEAWDGASHYEPVMGWRQMPSGATRTLVFPYSHSYAAGLTLRLEGIGWLDYPANDYTAVTMRAEYEDGLREFVGYYGAAQLHRNLALRDREHVREHLTLSQELGGLAERARRRGMPPKTGRTRVELPTYWS